jgi:hypothetical protein
MLCIVNSASGYKTQPGAKAVRVGEVVELNDALAADGVQRGLLIADDAGADEPNPYLTDEHRETLAKYKAKQAESNKADAPRATVGRLDGQPMIRSDDGLFHGDPVYLTDEQRAALPQTLVVESDDATEPAAEGVQLPNGDGSESMPPARRKPR